MQENPQCSSEGGIHKNSKKSDVLRDLFQGLINQLFFNFSIPSKGLLADLNTLALMHYFAFNRTDLNEDSAADPFSSG